MDNPVSFARLTARALVRLSGPDWRSFLQNLITQDVETLAAGQARFAALLTPQGKLLFDLFVIGRADDCLIDVAADRRDALIQRFSIYRLRAKVEIGADPGTVMALWPTPDGAAPGWVEDPRLPGLGLRGYGASPPAGAIEVEAEAYDAHRLALCVPDSDRDAPSETTYPIEANVDLLGGIDFQKGCFVGQETTSRMKRRGTIKNRMLAIDFEGPTPAFGAEVLAGTLRAGEVRTGAAGRAMALLRLDRVDAGVLTVDGRPVRVARPSYL